MEEITFQEFLMKSGQMLEKYRANIDHLKQIRNNIEKKFFNPEEMVAFFYANKSEYFTWEQTESSIITLEDAFVELVGNMMDAWGDQEAYKYYLRDKRIPVLVFLEEEEEEEEEKEEEELLLEEDTEEKETTEEKEEEEEELPF